MVRRSDHPFLGPLPLDEDPTGLALNGSPGREVARKIYDGDFVTEVPPVAGFSAN
jgi:hypothetical protein